MIKVNFLSFVNVISAILYSKARLIRFEHISLMWKLCSNQLVLVSVSDFFK